MRRLQRLSSIPLILALILSLVVAMFPPGVVAQDPGAMELVTGSDPAKSDPSYTHPAMHFDRETFETWLAAYNSAPRAYIDRDVAPGYPAPPGSQDLLGHVNYVPAERDQGLCGNCWAWAGTGVMEIALDVQEAVSDRLSVQYINSCQTGVIGKACCAGGWLADVADFYDPGTSTLTGSPVTAHAVQTVVIFPPLPTTASAPVRNRRSPHTPERVWTMIRLFRISRIFWTRTRECGSPSF
jgi:hypothetical protein